MAFTFFKAQGLEIGSSLVEADKVEFAGRLLAEGRDKIVLPVDFLVSDALDIKGRKVGTLKEVEAAKIPAGWKGVDIGPKSVARFRDLLKAAKTVVWNGPMGVFEIDQTARGTIAIAGIMAEITAAGATTVIGGGDSAAAIEKAGMADKVSHVSTGGGASLEIHRRQGAAGRRSPDRQILIARSSKPGSAQRINKLYRLCSQLPLPASSFQLSAKGHRLRLQQHAGGRPGPGGGILLPRRGRRRILHQPPQVRQHISQPPSAKRCLYFGDIPDAEWTAILDRRRPFTDLARSGFRLFPQTEDTLIALSRRYRLGSCPIPSGLSSRDFSAAFGPAFPGEPFFDGW
jgi:hypothetical protein